MKLKQDCVRDVLLFLEDNLTLDSYISNHDISLKDYSSDDITYTVMKLSEAGYLDTGKMDFVGIIPIKSITYDGHQLLESIRDDKVWKETKNTVSKLSSVSLPILQQVAAKIITNMIGLN